jgi:uncharacterized protein
MAATEAVAVAILAKAPVPGFAKTRLIPMLGPDGAAALQAALIARAAATACAAGIGPVTLWGAPDETDPAFAALTSGGLALARQGDGDLGTRMLAALAAANGPALVIGTDCPVLSAADLRTAAGVLRGGTDVVVFPADDGGYVLIGARRPEPTIFSAMHWSTPEVMEETRRRLRQFGLTWQEPVALWDVDLPQDVDRLRRSGLGGLIP